MNNTLTFRSTAIKTLAIVGFLATIALCMWLIVEGIRRAPSTFASLASMVESMRDYKPVNELSIATEKTVVNSAESFQISWTDVKQDGEYHFSYTCTQGIDLEVRGGDGELVPVSCTDSLSLPATVHGLFLSISSDTMRFSDVPIKVSFTNEGAGISLQSEAKITVVNATIPVTEPASPVVVPEPEPEKPVVAVAPELKPETPQTPAPKTPAYTTTTVYPQSNPNGFVDLSVTTLGSGILRNGTFVYTAKYDRDLRNAIKFDIRNVGTKTSGPWTFRTILPSGQVYESPVQIALKPMEHVEFTLGFDLNTNKRDDLAKITNTVYTMRDANSKNDRSVWHVVVRD